MPNRQLFSIFSPLVKPPVVTPSSKSEHVIEVELESRKQDEVNTTQIETSNTKHVATMIKAKEYSCEIIHSEFPWCHYTKSTCDRTPKSDKSKSTTSNAI